MEVDRNPPGFQNFDDPDVYQRSEEYLLKADALNFAIIFDSDEAIAAVELTAASFDALLGTKPASSQTRWINIFCPELQRDTIEVLANRYGFSPRLAGLMCSKIDTPEPAVAEPRRSGLRQMMHTQRRLERKSVESGTTDGESHELSATPFLHPNTRYFNHWRLVNEVWYYCSVDWGSKYLCVGYNSLSQLHATELNETDTESHMSNKPQSRRLWTWLIHCDDGTIITIHENPFPNRQGGLDAAQQQSTENMRRNLMIVFRQLSTVNDEWRKKNPIMSLPIRSGLLDIQGSPLTSFDAPSLLFYYLFDDWFTSYSLVAKQEHQYGKQLGLLREHMSQKPEVRHIQRLHLIGQQLAVLKKIYQSYALIIERILERQKPVNMSNSTQLLQEDVGENKAMLTAQAPAYAVALSSAATVRFERLRDRINLYALSEIQDCLDEKESLVFLNFNLITLKQSGAVEKLTRITILLAKVTILFMPVSLMTGYFSVQITDLTGKYTSTTYWVAFAVIMTLSLVFLVVFGKLSGTVEGKPIYRSFTQLFLTKSRSKISTRGAKKFPYTPEGEIPA